MRIPLRNGRDFDQRDTDKSPVVVMVNETFVRRFLSNVNPIGQVVLLDRGDRGRPANGGRGRGRRHETEETWAKIPRPEFYQPFQQFPNRRLWITLRLTSANLAGVDTAVRRVVQGIDPDVFVPQPHPDDVAPHQAWRSRVST